VVALGPGSRPAIAIHFVPASLTGQNSARGSTCARVLDFRHLVGMNDRQYRGTERAATGMAFGDMVRDDDQISYLSILKVVFQGSRDWC
jgi:hypothetical protein